MNKVLIVLACTIAIVATVSEEFKYRLSRGYQKAFAMMNYTYEALFDPGCEKEVCWKEKIFCKKEYASQEVMQFLRDIEAREKCFISKNQNRLVEEVFWQGKRVVVKSVEFRGWFPNLLRMGMGVNIWNNASFAKARGVPVLTPIALVEKRWWNKTKTFVVYPYEGEVCKNEIKESPKILVLKEALNQAKLIHDDFRFKNIVMLEDGTLQLIDIDKIHYYPKNSPVFKARMRHEFRKFNLANEVHAQN